MLHSGAHLSVCLLLGHFKKKKKKEILRVIFWKASAVGGEVVAPAGRG